MRILTTLLVVLFATAQLMAEPSVENCATDSATNSQQNNTTLLHQQNPTTLNVYIVDNEIHVIDMPDGVTLSIYSITGARVGSYTVRDGKVVLNNSLAKGIYIIRVNNRATKITIR